MEAQVKGVFAMNKRISFAFLIAIIMVANIFAGGKKESPAPAQSATQEESHEEPVTLIDEPVTPTPPSPPLVPLTGEILELAVQNDISFTTFIYYISAAVVLEKNKNDRRIIPNDKGEVTLQIDSAYDEINIRKDTGGLLTENPDGRPWVLKVYFSNESQFLSFKENAENKRFELDFNAIGGDKTVSFGGSDYILSFRERPYLQIRLAEIINNQPNIITLPGVSKD
jgi:hypothetical protein